MLQDFVDELSELCNKYGYSISGKTTNGSLIIKKASNVVFDIRSEDEGVSSIMCIHAPVV